MADFNSIYKRTTVYLEDRHKKPKHLFTVVGDIILNSLGETQESAILDVGGASGDFAYYINQCFPKMKLWCLDADQELISRAEKKIKNCKFLVGDANSMTELTDNSFDFVTMLGVLSIFDDYAPSLNECIRVTKQGGTIIIVSQFNNYPVDALIKWRYSGDNGPYNKGYNLFSKQTISNHLSKIEAVKNFRFENFILPFDLSPQEDPIRTWTEFDASGNRILRNGLMQINLQILIIEVN